MPFLEPTRFTWVNDPQTGKQRKKPARDTAWRARYRDPDGGTRSRTFDRKADAEDFLARTQTRVNDGEWTDPQLRKTLFAEWADLWWRTTEKLAPSTRRGYERMLKLYIRPVFDQRQIGSITWIDIELFVAAMTKEQRAPKTIRHTTSVLSLIFKTAMKAKVIKENPASGHAVTVRRSRPTILTMEQVHILVEHTDEWFRPAVWLLVFAGLRTSELCGLRVKDLNVADLSITIEEVQMWVKGELVVKGPKTDSGRRTIPIPAWLFEELKLAISDSARVLDRALALTDRIFVSRRGKPLTDHRVWKYLDRAQTRAGLPRFRPYDLRHSHASLLIELGAHPKAISERMGHSEIGVTMNVYGHLFEGAQRTLTDSLDRLSSRGSNTAEPGDLKAMPAPKKR